MEAGEGAAIMETVAEMVSEQYMNPLALLIDAMLIHLSDRGSIDPTQLSLTLKKQRQRLPPEERGGAGEQLIERAEMVCTLLATGRVSEADLHNVPAPHLRVAWSAPENPPDKP